MKWIDICSIYLNYTSPDTAQALLYKCLQYAFTTKDIDLNVKLREPNLS